ncbi:AGE family epimerase/isomerase [Propionivibrio sp.]|uniref:AGE family epimerase/isomerase n=1 Tax=Propionivibrio sp. TaxID=2212460 RepID=UPI003BF14D3F
MGSAIAQTTQSTVPEVRFDRVQGVIVETNPQQRRLVVKMPGGKTQVLNIAGNAYLHSLRQLDERQRVLDPKAVDGLQPGNWLAASGLIYSDSSELLVKEVSLFGKTEQSLVLEQPDWWSSQARDVAEFWVRTQFGAGEVGDASGYRTAITKSGEKRSDSVNLQETDTISRLIYGLSSAYLMNGNARVLRAASELVRYQRERLRIESADGRTVSWLHALRDGRPIVASRFSDDEGTIPLYEQIYAIAGLTQYYRVTGDPEVLADIEKTVRFMDEYYWDKTPGKAQGGGYFSHIHPGTLRPEDAGGQNARKKNWNSVGDHLPAYLENLYLGTRKPEYLQRMRELGTLIATHFPDPKSPFVFERFDAAWQPDLTYSWQQNRAVVGHNLKIAWCLTRLYHLTGDRDYLSVARGAADKMLVYGQDSRRGGWYDVIERMPDPVTGRYEHAWHDRKSWWQQEQGILANYILFAETGEGKYLSSARTGSGFFNLAFLDHDDGEVFFDVQSDGTPYLIGDRADKGSHSKSGYHILELDYFAHLYTNLLVQKRSVVMNFRPAATSGGTRFEVQPISLPPGKVKITAVTLNGKPYRDFDALAMSVNLPAMKEPQALAVTLGPR